MDAVMEHIVRGAADLFIGGWDISLQILLIVIGLDYLTGVACAFKNKTISSSIGYKGLVKKATIFIIVILAAQMDRMVGIENHLFRNCTAFFFTVNDALSIMENAGKMGMKLPAFLKSALVKLQQQTEIKGNDVLDHIEQEDKEAKKVEQEKGANEN